MYYLQVTDEDDSEKIEVPTEEDGTLMLSSLANLYPGVTGLKYNVDGHFRIAKLSDGKLLPPAGGWPRVTYYCVFPKDTKRKTEDEDDHVAKSSRTDEGKNPRWTYTDLVVLGLPWRTTDKELHDYFSKFGELQLAQVKVDPVTGKSKGFGFIRFSDSEVQVRVMLQRHQIDGRWCDVRVPLSKDSVVKKTPCKIFVGQCTEDMTENHIREHFIKYGKISDVYVPRPFRGFAFVTFIDSESVQSVCRQQHVINSKKVIVTEAIPKSATKDMPPPPRGGSSANARGYKGGARGKDDDYYRDIRGSYGSGSSSYGSSIGSGGRRIDEKEWRADPRYEEAPWNSSKNWNRPQSSWQEKPPEKNINPDFVAKVVNKAVLGVIENLKTTQPSATNPETSAIRAERENWWSRR